MCVHVCVRACVRADMASPDLGVSVFHWVSHGPLCVTIAPSSCCSDFSHNHLTRIEKHYFSGLDFQTHDNEFSKL